MTGQDTPKEARLWVLGRIIPIIYFMMVEYPTLKSAWEIYHQLTHERHQILISLKAA